MGAAATYRVGRSDFFTPADLADDATTLNAQIEQLDTLLDGNTAAPQAWFDSWGSFVAQWKGFYNRTFAGNGFFGNLFTALNDSNRDELVSYEDRFDTWAKDAQQYGGGLPEGNRTTVSQGSGDSIDNQLKKLGLPSLGTVAIVLVALTAAVIAWKAVK